MVPDLFLSTLAMGIPWGSENLHWPDMVESVFKTMSELLLPKHMFGSAFIDYLLTSSNLLNPENSSEKSDSH